MAEKYKAPSVKKAFDILKLIADKEEGLGVIELSKQLRISKSTVHGITAALEELGAIIRDPESKRYRLGFTLFELGRRAYGQIDLRTVVRPVMERLMRKTGSSVFLGVFNAEHVTILDVVESVQDLKITSPIGTKIPILAGATGKVFLASLPEQDAMRIVLTKGLNHYTPNSITNPSHYFQEIRAARQKGYATDDEEYIMGLRAVATAIQAETSLMAAIWVVGFKASLDDQRFQRVISDTLEASEAISRLIRQQPLPAGTA